MTNQKIKDVLTDIFFIWTQEGNICQLHLAFISYIPTRKFYIRRSKNKLDSTELGRTVIVHLFPSSDQENYSSPRCFNY